MVPVLYNKNVLAFGQTKNKIYVGFSSDNTNVLEATVSSKPIEVSEMTELFLRTSASSAKSGRQIPVK